MAHKRAAGSHRPAVNLHYLVWKENYEQIPRRYSLARELDVDSILFNGFSFLPPEKQMSDDEVARMMRLYEGIVRIDEYRRITTINGFERDISQEVRTMNDRLAAERSGRGVVQRLRNFIGRKGYSLPQKAKHYWRMHQERQRTLRLQEFEEACEFAKHRNSLSSQFIR